MGKAVNIIEHHTKLEAARLQIVSYTETRQHPFVLNRIAGYPLLDKPAPIDTTKSHKLASLLLDDNNYNYGRRYRCIDRGMIGLHFVKADAQVDVSIGADCHLVVVCYRDGVEIKWWGEIMNDEAATALFGLLD